MKSILFWSAAEETGSIGTPDPQQTWRTVGWLLANDGVFRCNSSSLLRDSGWLRCLMVALNLSRSVSASGEVNLAEKKR